MTNLKRPFAIFAVIALICLVGIPAWAIWKRGSPSAAVQPISGSDATAQRLFQTNCGACHTLAAAGTDGVVAPNLDVLLATGPESKTVVDGNCARVLSAIDNGVGGRMPAGILQGEDAKLVANFVARNVAYVNPTSATATTSSGGSSSSGSTTVSASQVKCQTAPSAPAKGGAAPPKPKPKPKPAPAAPSGGASKLAVAADASGLLKFDQTSLAATAGNVTVDFTNQSPLQHDFCIQQGTKQLGCTSIIQGSSTSKTFGNLKSGSYTFYCSVDGHEAAGMKGTLTVK